MNTTNEAATRTPATLPAPFATVPTSIKTKLSPLDASVLASAPLDPAPGRTTSEIAKMAGCTPRRCREALSRLVTSGKVMWSGGVNDRKFWAWEVVTLGVKGGNNFPTIQLSTSQEGCFA